MMHIWMISSSFYPHVGGGETQLQRLSEQLTANGWTVHIVTRRHNKLYSYLPECFEAINGVPIHRLPSPGPASIGSVSFLVAGVLFLLRHRSNAIYHAHGIGASGWIAVIAGLLLRGKAVIKLRSGVENYQSRRRSFLGRLSFQLQCRLADSLIVVNSALAGALRKWGVASDRILYFPNSIDVVEFRPAARDEVERLREELLSPLDANRRFIFLYVGRLVYWKGVDILLEAWAMLPHMYRDVSLLCIAGDGPLRSQLVDKAEMLGVSDTVRFLGYRDDVPTLLKTADVFVLPSRTEGLSNAMLEAMASGLPIVCTAVGGTPDWITHGVNGFIAAPNAPSFQCAVVEMLANYDQWELMGARSRDVIERELSWGATLSKLEAEYRRLEATR